MTADPENTSPLKQDTDTTGNSRLKSSPIPSWPESQSASTTFQFDDPMLRPQNTRNSHWSIAWSDLMMTMFILFLSMFVYQAAHQDFLFSDEPEIVGGSTTEALITSTEDEISLPLTQLQQGLPLMTAGTIKKVVPVSQDEVEIDSIFETEIETKIEPETKTETDETKEQNIIPPPATLEPGSAVAEAQKADDTKPATPPLKTALLTPITPASQSAQETKQIETPETTPQKPGRFKEIYDLSKQALSKNSLEEFASIDLVPDSTMRIILTGDLLFKIGDANLSQKAKRSLKKIATVIKDTPYMINVIGHTDNIPMHSPQFDTNWELSVVRATSVARFLMDEAGMSPIQFVVSGYSSYRPVVKNTTKKNRAINRRVEIIISKRLPPARKATTKNIQ